MPATGDEMNAPNTPTASNETAIGRAIRTIAARGRESTLVDVVNGRVLRAHADAIERYLVLRTGDREIGRRALRELRATVAVASADDFVAPPSVRAHLYRLARVIAYRHRADMPRDSSANHVVPWAFGRSGRPDEVTLHAVRSGVSDASLELLELRLLRGLSHDEIALVLGSEGTAVTTALAGAESEVARVLGDAFGDGTRLGEIIDEALAIELEGNDAEGPHESDEFDPLPVGTILGRRYTLEKRVGAGAFGEVYRASDTEVPGHVVALKLLYQPATSPEARAAALRELHLIASVFHPSIVQFKDHGWHENRLWFVMPWYQGESLEARMRRAPLGREEAHRIFTSLARALSAMHAAGIRHQDVKPDNVYLAKIKTAGDDDVLPVLLDLGVAAKEAEMIVAGTPTYFAPEVASQFANVDSRPNIGVKADVFSLALTLRNALDPATEPSIEGGVEVFIAHRATTLPPAPNTPDLRYLAPHFARWMTRDPSARPDAETFAAELDVLLEPEAKRARRRALLAVVVPIVVVALSILGLVGFILTRKVETERREVARARHREAELSAELGTTRTDNTRTVAALSHAQAQLQQGRLSNSELERAVSMARSALDSAVERVDAMKTRAEIAERELAAESARLTEARAEATRETSRASRLDGELALRTAELDRERATLSDLRTRFDETMAALDRTRMDLERARTDVSRVESELAAATSRATGAERRIEDAVTRANRAEQDADDARARVRQLERDLERARASGGPPVPVPPP